jgi:hypothetical protein
MIMAAYRFMNTRLVAIPALLASCAAALPPASKPIVGIRAAGILQRETLRFTDVHACQVLVEGCWTVGFAIDERDLPWLRDLVRQHGEAELVWNGRAVWTLDERVGRRGYFIDRGFSDEATARRLADEIRRAQGPSGTPASQQADAAGRPEATDG